MRKATPLLIAFIVIFSASAGSAQTGETAPVRTVKAFYKYDGSHSQSFVSSTLAARRRWFSRGLYSLFRRELRRQAALKRTSPDDKPFFSDGFPFRPYDEVCRLDGKDVHQTLRVVGVFTQRNRAAVNANFLYPKRCEDSHGTGYRLFLIREGKRWVIDDLRYPDGSSLRQDMSRKD